ncbi:zinc finger MYM-type 1-like, partial [Paramuricea clavata]
KLSDTRWACRADSITAIYNTFEAVIATLKEVREKEKKPHIAAEAKGLLQNIYNFEFILALEVLKKVLLLSKGVSDKLQSEDLDVVTGCERVTDLLASIRALQCEPKFEAFWESTLQKCRILSIEEPKDERLRKIPRRIDDNPETTVHLSPKDKFRVSFYYNILDLMSSSIESRFDKHNAPVLKGLGYLGPSRLASPEAWENISLAVQWFQSDLDVDALESEIFSLQTSLLLTNVNKKAKSEKRKASFDDLFKVLQTEPECYGNVIKLMKITLTLPLTSTSAERAFSKLKLIKSRLRSTMKQERLESLMLMSVEADILEQLDLEELVEKFVDMAPRKMDLV